MGSLEKDIHNILMATWKETFVPVCKGFLRQAALDRTKAAKCWQDHKANESEVKAIIKVVGVPLELKF